MSDESRSLLATLRVKGAAGLDHDIRYLGGNLREGLAHYRVLFPELVSYREGLFLEAHFSQREVDHILDGSTFDANENPVATAERHINQVWLAAQDDQRGFDADMARANAAAIGWVWKRWIGETYGVSIQVGVSVSGPDDCSVWFESAPDEGDLTSSSVDERGTNGLA